MSLRRRRRDHARQYATWNGILAIALLLVAGVAGYEAITARTSAVSHNSRELFQFPSETIQGVVLPAINVFLSVTFTAEGSISQDNTVSVHVLVVNSSIPDFPKYYSGIAFTDAVAYNSANPSFLQPLVWQYQMNGSYVANGKLKWETSGPTYVILLPNAYLFPNATTVPYYLLVTAPQVESTDPIYQIADSSQTPSLNGVDNGLFFGWITVAGIALSLQPILLAVIPKKSRTQGRQLRELTVRFYNPLYEWLQSQLTDPYMQDPEELFYGFVVPPPNFRGTLQYDVQVPNHIKQLVDNAKAAQGAFLAALGQLTGEYNDRSRQTLNACSPGTRFATTKIRVPGGDIPLRRIIGSEPFTAFISSISNTSYTLVVEGPPGLEDIIDCPRLLMVVREFKDLPSYSDFHARKEAYIRAVQTLSSELIRSQRSI